LAEVWRDRRPAFRRAVAILRHDRPPLRIRRSVPVAPAVIRACGLRPRAKPRRFRPVSEDLGRPQYMSRPWQLVTPWPGEWRRSDFAAPAVSAGCGTGPAATAMGFAQAPSGARSYL